VFGDGHDYDWALAGDDEMDFEEERLKPEMRYQDVRIFFTNYLTEYTYPPTRFLNRQR